MVGIKTEYYLNTRQKWYHYTALLLTNTTQSSGLVLQAIIKLLPFHINKHDNVSYSDYIAAIMRLLLSSQNTNLKS
jgi:hypothetical protein